MPNKPNTIAEQIASLNETVKENGVILPPKIKEYLNSNIRIILDKNHNNEDITKEDVEFIGQIKSYCLLPKKFRDEIQSIEEMIEKLVNKLKLNEQYTSRLETLKYYGFLDEKGEEKEGDVKLSSYERTINTLTLQELEVASHFQKPILLIIPECSFKSKIKALDSHKQGMQQNNTYIQDDYFKNDSGSNKITGYRVTIVDGANVMEVYEGDDLDVTIKERTEKRKQDRKQDESGMDRDKYVLLMMESLKNSKPIDTETFTLLDDDSFKDDSRVHYAYFFSDNRNVRFYSFRPGHGHADARLRSSVGGNIILN